MATPCSVYLIHVSDNRIAKSISVSLFESNQQYHILLMYFPIALHCDVILEKWGKETKELN